MIVRPSGPVEIDSKPLPHDVIILPNRTEGDFGTYDGTAADLMKQLRSDGVDAGYWHAADQRRWRMGLGPVVVELAIGFGAAVAGGAAWEAIKAAVEHVLGKHAHVHVTVVRQRRQADGELANDWYEFTGDSASFIAALSAEIEPADPHAGT